MIPRLVPRVSSSLVRPASSISSASSSSSSSFVRHYSLRSSSSSLSASSCERAFIWKHLVGPQSTAETIEAFKGIEAFVNNLEGEVKKLQEKKAPEIDWKHYSKVIKSRRGFLKLFKAWARSSLKLQAQSLHASLIPDAPKTDAPKTDAPETEEGFEAKFNKLIDKVIEEQRHIATITEEEAAQIRPQILTLEVKHALIGDNVPLTSDLVESMPGLKEQLAKEYENAEFVPTEAEEAVANIDLQAVRNIVEKGGSVLSLLPDKVAYDRLGTFNMEEEYKKILEMEKKMFANKPGFKSQLQAELPLQLETDPYADEQGEDHHH